MSDAGAQAAHRAPQALWALTAKAYAVGKALLYTFHNSRNGRCFPGYEAIAAAADCHRSSVAEYIAALEDNGILTWDNRIKRVWEEVCAGVGGRVHRYGGAYGQHRA
jgi:hypothetical protein